MGFTFQGNRSSGNENEKRMRALVSEASQKILSVCRDPKEDARAERAKATFDTTELMTFMRGGDERCRRREQLAKLLASQPWGDKTTRYFLTREQEYVKALQSAIGIWELMRKHKLPLDDGIDMRNLLGFPGGLELHIGMFIPSILSQGTQEQQAKWLPLCNRLQIIGTYAQTELGHGTFIRGLETLAVYDKEQDSFVVHSPTLTATKWWPGGLGKTATHVILMARLFIDGNDYGPHGFVVQIRDMETHRPLDGVEVGDIGPKLGFNGVDNGWLRFDHVVIPRDAMLMRFAKVTNEGKYIPPPPSNSKASYATMVYVRATIVRDAGDFLGRAVTIATRYTAVRRQSSPSPNGQELQILDYDNVQQTLLPLVAESYALKFMGEKMMRMYNDFDSARDKGDFSRLPELHALSSGLKSLCTDIAARGIEDSRRTCGGQGYSVLSGLPSLYASYVQNVTWEGDNNVMYLQTARYIVKNLLGMVGEHERESYLLKAGAILKSKCPVNSLDGWAHFNHSVTALQYVAVRLSKSAVETLQAASGGTIRLEGDAWNSSTVDLIRAAKAYCGAYVHQSFIEALLDSKDRLSEASSRALEGLAHLHGVSLLLEFSSELLEDGYATGQQVSWLKKLKRKLSMELRPNAVPLVDSFGYEDYLLNSCIGRKDGDVYRALLEAAKSSPLNMTQEGPAWEHVLKPLLSPSTRTRSKL